MQRVREGIVRKSNSTHLEPLNGGTKQTREVLVHIGDVIDFRGQRIVHIDGDYLPVGFALVNQGNGAQHLDLQHVAALSHSVANLDDIDGIVVTLAAGGGLDVVGVFPGLGQGSVVPDVALVREAVGHEPQLTLLDVLLDGIHRGLQANLRVRHAIFVLFRSMNLRDRQTDLHFRVGPTWHLHHHVVDSFLLVGVQWNVVHRRDDIAALVFCGEWPEIIMPDIWATPGHAI